MHYNSVNPSKQESPQKEDLPGGGYIDTEEEQIMGYTHIADMHWEEIRELFSQLTAEKQCQFIAYLLSRQDTVDNSKPRLCDPEAEPRIDA